LLSVEEQAQAQTSFYKTGEKRLKLPARARRLFSSDLARLTLADLFGAGTMTRAASLASPGLNQFVF
jgi:hypothetical protein